MKMKLVGSAVLIVVSICTMLILLSIEVDKILNPADPDKRLVTEARLLEVANEKADTENEYDGYCFVDGIRHDCDFLDTVKDMVKVGYGNYSFNCPGIKKIWIPKKDYHKYYTLDELSEIVNEIIMKMKYENENKLIESGYFFCPRCRARYEK